MTSQQDTEQPDQAITTFGGVDVKKLTLEDMQALTSWKDKEVRLARLDERKSVALYNYNGKTFSNSTDYKAKFDKFIRNNELRIKSLQLQGGKK